MSAQLAYVRTSQGHDVFLAGQRIGAILESSAYGLVFFRAPSGLGQLYPDVATAKRDLERAVTRALAAGQVPA